MPAEGLTTDLNLSHLHAELARMDLMFQRAILCWRRAGQDPADTFRGLYVSHAEVDGLLARPIGSNWGQTVILTEEEEEALAQAAAQAMERIQAITGKAEKMGYPLRLQHLAQTFGLNRFDLDVLLLCLAPSLDLRYEKLYGYLQDDVTRKWPTVNLALDLLGVTGLMRVTCLDHFTEQAPLIRFRLLERGDRSGGSQASVLNQTLAVDETLVGWLFGKYEPSSTLTEQVALINLSMTDPAADRLTAGEVWNELQGLATPTPGEQPIFIFYGADHLSREAAARLLAAQFERPLMTINLTAEPDSPATTLSTLQLALRDARLMTALPYVSGWDSLLGEQKRLAHIAVFRALNDYPGPVIIAGEQRWQPEAMAGRRPIRWHAFPAPAYSQRLRLWTHFLAEPATEFETELAALGGQFALTGQQIRDAVAYAQDLAAQRNQPITADDLFAAARTFSNLRLATLARKIDPRYEWADIILPEDQRVILHEIVATVRGRARVLEEWGVGRKLASSAGVTVLFAGPPGTGKTMAAEVIANELNLDLYKIDLSTVISKYIGETEKNLEKIFAEAQSSNAILFFDEADAIFGKRSEVKDAHDRYANIEVSYLLQRMEAYDGVTILATNLRANLDEAFTRRLQFALDFPFPEEADRLRIWQTLFPPDVPRAADLDFLLFARRFRLAGGNIRNIIVSAAYLAAADGGLVTMQHLLHGTRRELQKMGRWVEEGDLVVE